MTAVDGLPGDAHGDFAVAVPDLAGVEAAGTEGRDFDAVFRGAADRYGSDVGELHVARRIEDDAAISMRLEGQWTPPWEQ